MTQSPAKTPAVSVTGHDVAVDGVHDGLSIPDDVSLVGSYRRTSFVFGQQRPVFLPASPIPTAVEGLPLPEREHMLLDEQELLKDNMEHDGGYGGIFNVGRPGTTGGADERTALLGPSVEPQWAEAVESGTLHTTFALEAKVLIKTSIPLYITFLLQYSLTLSSIFAAGNLGKNELAGVSLGAMTAVITAYAPYQGFSTALDTLCAQAYGAGNKTLVGLHLQRMILFLLVVTVPVVILWVFSEPLLNMIIPDPELVKFTALYLRILVFGAPGFAIFEASKRFLQAQGLFSAATYVLLICAPLNAYLNYVLVWHPTIGLGFAGAPVAVAIIDWLMPLLLFLYVRFVAGYECWGGFSRRALVNWTPMIKLAIPGFIMLEAEYLAFEILTLAASYFSTAHVAAQSILSTTVALTFQLGFATAIATSTRIANLLGATLGDAAKTTAKTGMVLSMIIGVLNLVLIVVVRKQYVLWFSDDEEVIELFIKSIPVGALFQLVDALGVTTAGILRGQGKQKIGSYINLFAYYVIGLPISFALAFGCHLELVGLWTGVAISLLFISVVEVAIISQTDWDQVVNDAKERMHTNA